MRKITVAIICLLAVSPLARAAVTETFSAPVATANGTLLGVCQQMAVTLFGGGQVTVGGNGAAVIGTPLYTDAAFLASASALPASAYKVTVALSQINFPQEAPGGLENGVTLLAIANTVPLAANDLWWANYRMLSIEVDVTPDATQQHPLFINYWDSANIYTWNGTQWGVGDPNWVPALYYDPQQSYTVEIEKASGWYTLRVLSGTTLLTQAQVPVTNVRPATTEYFVVGDRLTSHFHGTMNIHSVTMPSPPGCTTGIDGGITLDGSPSSDLGPVGEAGVIVDGGVDAATSADGSGTPDGSAQADSAVSPDAAGKADGSASQDVGARLDHAATPDRGASGDRGVARDIRAAADQGTIGKSGSCDCALAQTPAEGPGLLLCSLLLALGLLRRRFRHG